MEGKSSVKLTVDLLCFSNYRPDSLTEVASGITTIAMNTANLTFSVRDDKPKLPRLRPDEWLARSAVLPILKSASASDTPLIAVTNRRLTLDFFGDTFPEDRTAIITTYNSDQIPRLFSEKQYLAYSLVYCTVDIIANPRLWHVEPRGCLFDQVNSPAEISLGLQECKVCEDCLRTLAGGSSTSQAMLSFTKKALRWVRSGCRIDESQGVLDKAARRRQSPPPDAAQTSRFPLKQGVLTINRETMAAFMADRWSLDQPELSLDRPPQVTALLQQITERIQKPDDHVALTVRRLVEENHRADLLYLDLPDKRHRDHSLHQLYVALLGFVLLDTFIDVVEEMPRAQLQQRRFRDLVAKTYSIKEETVDWAWYITAILHDHAYPLANSLSRAVRILRFGPELGDPRYLVERVRSDVQLNRNLMSPKLFDLVSAALGGSDTQTRWRNGLGPDQFEEEYSSLIQGALSSCVNVEELPSRMATLRYDHGVVGAANITLHLGDNTPGYLAPVCRAIFDHNLLDTIPVEKRPLSFLLKLCDTIQEWDRRVYTHGGRIVRESEAIRIGPFSRKREGLRLISPIKLSFSFTRPELLELSGWRQEIWQESTRKHLECLKSGANTFVRVSEISVEHVERIKGAA